MFIIPRGWQTTEAVFPGNVELQPSHNDLRDAITAEHGTGVNAKGDVTSLYLFLLIVVSRYFPTCSLPNWMLGNLQLHSDFRQEGR